VIKPNESKHFTGFGRIQAKNSGNRVEGSEISLSIKSALV
jgi:hypothetical protein